MGTESERIAELEQERGELIAAACWWRDYAMNGRQPTSPYPDFARFSSIPFPPAIRPHGTRGGDVVGTETEATDFVNGWVVGYMEAGGSLTDDGLAERAVRAYERRLQPRSLPAVVLLADAIAAARDVAQRSVQEASP